MAHHQSVAIETSIRRYLREEVKHAFAFAQSKEKKREPYQRFVVYEPGSPASGTVGSQGRFA